MDRLPAQTTPPQAPQPTWPRLARSVGAIVAGYVAITVLVTVAWMVLSKIAPGQFRSSHANPTLLVFLADTLIAVGAGAIAGYLTGFLAGRSETVHAMILGGFMAVLSVVTALIPNTEYDLPGWHSFLLIAVMLISVWLGAHFRQSQRLAAK